MDFIIEPYVGAGPLKFGMSGAEIEAILGKPVSTNRPVALPSWLALSYDGMCVGLDPDHRLAHIGFDDLFSGKVTLHNIDLFRDADAFNKLLELDHEAFLWVGFVMLMGLGICLGGFHEMDGSGRGFHLFPRGRYDAKRHEFEPFLAGGPFPSD